MEPYIGIAITTKNREKSFNKCMDYHLEFKPKNSKIFVVDDGSDSIYCNSDVRNEESKGISSSKNSCIKLMYESGCDILWLFDDDAYPLCDYWYIPYLESKHNHLSRTFYPSFGIDGIIKYHMVPNGMAMMYTRKCIETVGGFDTRFPNKYEHTSMSRRIYNSGLTPHPFMDIVGSEKLIYSLDEHNEIERSFTQKEMNDNLKSGYDYFMSQANSKDFKEFRT